MAADGAEEVEAAASAVAAPTAAPATDAPAHGWAAVGVVVAEVGGGVVGARVAGGFVVMAPVVVGDGAGGGVAVTVGELGTPGAGVVVAGADGTAGEVPAPPLDVVPDPVVAWPVPVTDAAPVAPRVDAAVVATLVPVAAVAKSAAHKLASSTRMTASIRVRRRHARPRGLRPIAGHIWSNTIGYPNLTVRVTVRRCPAPSSAAKRRMRVPALMPPSRWPRKLSLMRLRGWVICDSVS